MATLQVSREQAIRFRLHANHLDRRLPAGSIVESARYGLQDTAPRDGILAMHARIDGCMPDDWADHRLIQTYSPRAAVYILPVDDFGVFTLGRMPLDAGEQRAIEDDAERLCSELGGVEVRGCRVERRACASGRIALRWTTSALFTREVGRPDIEPDIARRELCRRHVHAFGPTTPETYAWWSGLRNADARQVWTQIADELVGVDLDGRPGWILAEDEDSLRHTPEPTGARLLPAPDLRLFGLDRDGRFAGPGQRRLSALYDTFHPNGVLLDGKIIGTWGRRRTHVDVRVQGRLSTRAKAAIEAEAMPMPIRGRSMSVTITMT